MRLLGAPFGTLSIFPITSSFFLYTSTPSGRQQDRSFEVSCPTDLSVSTIIGFETGSNQFQHCWLPPELLMFMYNLEKQILSFRAL